ncbi:hypothetical protein AB0L14_22815 [Streptomyces sp. NPDC052727]|uniref:hypothetical protein n=1 Tax=Streptomyces sp. NPDC052727 TaxID=3154854 RepID=UPI00342F5F42
METVSGEVRAERSDPRASFPNDLHAAWDDLHVAYFAGYAMWTYLTSPFTFGSDGFKAVELSPVTVEAETWRRLRVTFPDHIATHCREQVFYFGPDGLLRRHDIHTRGHQRRRRRALCLRLRRVRRLGEDGTVSWDTELVTIDVESVLFI